MMLKKALKMIVVGGSVLGTAFIVPQASVAQQLDQCKLSCARALVTTGDHNAYLQCIADCDGVDI